MKYLSNLMDNILLLQSSTTGAEDGYVWLLNPSREYSSKTGYLALHLEDATTYRTPNFPDDFNWFKSVWNTQLLHKIQIFLWKVLQNAIPTGDNLQKRRVLTNTTASDVELKKQRSTCSSIVSSRNRCGIFLLGLHDLMLMKLPLSARNYSLHATALIYHHRGSLSIFSLGSYGQYGPPGTF
ncbi:hypothetical protein F2Q68_00044729 [Brassica cretica]|uniref:Reverse transcriptase zinc-binding domain-containing protein n=1 Tax=Brassica cretica TaxID=69181 RepID=A0A8S9LKE6_BRACR|nr:hypothetical protein F2Q68_00044729 [Brassica cretica]